MNTKNQILELIRVIKNHVEDSPMNFDAQSECIDAMQKILDLCNIDN